MDSVRDAAKTSMNFLCDIVKKLLGAFKDFFIYSYHQYQTYGCAFIILIIIIIFMGYFIFFKERSKKYAGGERER